MGKLESSRGRAQGLGTAYARALASEGRGCRDLRHPAGSERRGRRDRGDERSNGARVSLRCLGCRRPIRGFVDSVLRDFGGVDVVVMNAAIYGSSPLDLSREEALSEYERFYNTNVRSVYLLERAFAASLVEREGDIVVISTDHVLPPLEPGRHARRTRERPLRLLEVGAQRVHPGVGAWVRRPGPERARERPRRWAPRTRRCCGASSRAMARPTRSWRAG